MPSLWLNRFDSLKRITTIGISVHIGCYWQPREAALGKQRCLCLYIVSGQFLVVMNSEHPFLDHFTFRNLNLVVVVQDAILYGKYLHCCSKLHSKKVSNAKMSANISEVMFSSQGRWPKLSLSSFYAARSGCCDTESGLVDCLPGQKLMLKSKQSSVSIHQDFHCVNCFVGMKLSRVWW